MKDQKISMNATDEPERGKLFDSVARFLSGRSLKVKIPTELIASSARAATQSECEWVFFKEIDNNLSTFNIVFAAKQKKSVVGPVLLGLGAIFLTMVPIMMGGLALLSSKAVLLSKIAMVVSIILFVQYFFNHGKVNT